MFLTVEGLDGAGSTSIVDTIDERFDNARTTAEPSTLWTGQNVRNVLAKDDSPPLMDFYLFMADRVHHINEHVRPVDEQGGLVISDRYADSTRAYQPVALTQAGIFESQWEAKDFIERTMEPWDYEPDLTIYLDVSVETALQRCDSNEKYEDRVFLKKVRENYVALAESNDRIVTVDAEQPLDAVEKDVFEEIGAALDATGAVEGW